MTKPIRHGQNWRIRWLDADSKRRSEVYRTYKQAQHALHLHEVEAEEIRRGLRKAAAEPRRFDDLCDLWTETRAKIKKSGDDDKSIIRAHLRPAFGAMWLHEITTEHTDRFWAERAHRERQTIRNQLVLLGTMLRYAKALGWIAHVPKINLPKLGQVRSRKFRWLREPQEIKKLLVAARAEGEIVYALYATAIYTGMRQGELAALRWSDIDFGRRLITVARSFDTSTKNENTWHVPILDPLMPILLRWRQLSVGKIVFPNQRGTLQSPSARIFNEVFHRVLARAEFGLADRRGKLRPPFTFHDLRHTFASHWVARGGDIFRLQKVLGHSSIELTERYAHLSADAFARDHGRLGGIEPVNEADVEALKKSEAEEKEAARKRTSANCCGGDADVEPCAAVVDHTPCADADDGAPHANDPGPKSPVEDRVEPHRRGA
jgi:integrase